MSTRARIGVMNADNTVTSIYTHNDGYISHHGPILLTHYGTEAKARELLALGALSRLAGNLGEKHNFDTSYTEHPDWCCAYSRDRSVLAGALSSVKDAAFTHALNEFPGEEFNYLFRNGKWEVSEDCRVWRDLYLETVTERLTS